MKTRYSVALAMLAGGSLGAATIHGIYAQAKPPSYVVVDIGEITDPEGLKALSSRPTANPKMKELGGHYVIRSSSPVALDGAAPKRFVVIAFDSTEKAHAFANSEGQKEVNVIRMKTTKSRSFIVEGAPQ